MKRHVATILAVLLVIGMMTPTASAASFWQDTTGNGWGDWGDWDGWDDSELEDMMSEFAEQSGFYSESNSKWHEETVIETNKQTASKHTQTVIVNGVTTTQVIETDSSNDHSVITKETNGKKTTVTTGGTPTTSQGQGTPTIKIPTIIQGTTTTVQVPTINQNTNTNTTNDGNTNQIPKIKEDTSYGRGFNQGLQLYYNYDLELYNQEKESDATYSKAYLAYVTATKSLLEAATKNQKTLNKAIKNYNQAIESFQDKKAVTLDTTDALNIQGFQDAVIYESYLHAFYELYYNGDITWEAYRNTKGVTLQEEETHDTIMQKVESLKEALRYYGEDVNITIPYFI